MQQAQHLNLSIDGMHCEACVRRVTHALGSLPGVAVDQVQVGHAAVTYDPALTNPSTLSAAVDQIGFKVIEHSAI